MLSGGIAARSESVTPRPALQRLRGALRFGKLRCTAPAPFSHPARREDKAVQAGSQTRLRPITPDPSTSHGVPGPGDDEAFKVEAEVASVSRAHVGRRSGCGSLRASLEEVGENRPEARRRARVQAKAVEDRPDGLGVLNGGEHAQPATARGALQQV